MRKVPWPGWLLLPLLALPSAILAATPSVSAGGAHSLALTAGGAMRAWGNDAAGQLGARPLYSTSPAQVRGLTGASQAASGRLHSVVRRADGSVWGWGYNAAGPIGDGTANNRATAVPAMISQVTRVAAGGHHTLARRSDGTLWAWGFNDQGQLGDGTFLNRYAPVMIAGASGVAGMAAGNSHSVVVKADGTVWTWGANVEGELGTGSGPARPTPLQVPGLLGVIAVAAPVDGAYSIALKGDGTVWGWGSNDLGQLGDGTQVDRYQPVKAQGLTNVVAISAGRFHALALREDGTVWAWGANFNGQLGDGTFTFRTTPAPVPGLASVQQVVAGSAHNLARLADGTVRAWGANEYGELGDGTLQDRPTPIAVPGVAGISAVDAGGGQSIALRSDGTAVAWGSNISAQLGDGAPITRTFPAPATNLVDVTAIAAGGNANMALRADGSVWMWGGNFSGELGDGKFISRSEAAIVPGLPVISQIAAGGNHSLARTGAGAVYSWGANDRGQLGDATTAGRSAAAIVPGLTAQFVAGGYRHSVAVIAGGAVRAWGRNDKGQLGDGTLADRTSPVMVPGLSNITAVAAGLAHTTAVQSPGGTVWAWGSNDTGQLGNGTTTDSKVPVQVTGLTGVIALANGAQFSMALKSDGTVWTWGEAFLGNGTFLRATTPIKVATLSNIVAIAAGDYHMVALTADGSARTWGYNATYGAVGDGTYVNRATPGVVMATNGAGSLDANNWFMDLDPAVPSAIPAAETPRQLAIAQVSGSSDRLDLGARTKYLAADNGKRVNLYVMGLVPAGFLSLVKTAPGATSVKELSRKAGESLVLVQLTPRGWTDVNGQLIAYAQGIANAQGGASNILDAINTTLIPGAKFCVGYGESADAMLGSQALREVLDLEGAAGTSSGLPCVLSGVYVSGPVSSISGTTVTFDASVVGISPTGSVQFRDGLATLQAAVTLASSNAAVSRASIATAALAPGVHSIGASYSGDGQNPADTTSVPLAHEVKPAAPGSSSVALSGPVSSEISSEVVFTATVTGSTPTGSVQFKDGGVDLGAPQPILGATSALRVSTLAVGSHSITAAYAGDTNNAASTSNAVAHTVHALITTHVTLTSSANPAAFGAPIVLNSTVAGTNPTGAISFRAGATLLATVPLAGTSASTTVNGLAAGVHELTASYSGDGNNQAVTSAPIVQQVFTQTAGTAPAPFAFAARPNVAPGSTVTSNAIKVSGIGAPAPVVVTGGAYSIGCTTTFTTTSGTVANGESVCVRHAASASNATATHTTLTIGGVSATLSSTTYAASFPGAVATFVTHYYQSILRRAPDAGGQAFWSSEAMRLAALGADPAEAFFAMAMGFYTSPEYAAFGRNNTGFATDLYTTFFNRAPDSGGLAFWVSQLDQGMPREVALASFMFSAEFRAFSQAAFGSTAARAEVNAVMDFYRGLLARVPDDGGFGFWASRFRAAQCQGQAAIVAEVEAISSAFALSAEYAGRNPTHAQYVGDLYNAFLRRGGDLGGVQFWINQVASGARTREQVRAEFKNSPEFQARVNAIIAQGCLG